MENKQFTNYNQNNIKAIDCFLSDEGEGLDYLKKTYTMVQTNSRQSVNITKKSREKCVKGLIR